MGGVNSPILGWHSPFPVSVRWHVGGGGWLRGVCGGGYLLVWEWLGVAFFLCGDRGNGDSNDDNNNANNDNNNNSKILGFKSLGKSYIPCL